MKERTFLIPDWIDPRTNINILAGIEPFIKREQGVWYKKVVRCNKCGKCCMDVPKDWSRGQGSDGNCQFLILSGNEYLCGLGANRPYKCCIGDGDSDDCCIEWELMN